jgi:tetratricopeptide (TPR) repeat protein
MGLAQALTSWAELVKPTPRKGETERLLGQAIHHYQFLKKSVPQDPKNPRLLVATYLALAGWLWEQGRPEDAAKPYQRALAVAPDDPVVNNNLAWFLVTALEPRLWKPAEAVRLAQKAVDARPNEGDFWNTLGVAHFRNGDDQAAIAALGTSMRRRAGGDSYDWFFLAMAHGRRGEHDKAAVWLNRAVKWMAQHQPLDGELRRFRSEAEALLAQAKQE